MTMYKVLTVDYGVSANRNVFTVRCVMCWLWLTVYLRQQERVHRPMCKVLTVANGVFVNRNIFTV